MAIYEYSQEDEKHTETHTQGGLPCLDTPTDTSRRFTESESESESIAKWEH